MKDIRIELEKISNEESIFKKVAQYLLDYNGDYNKLKISNIANEAFCSTATVTRLSQHLGLSGFSELKVLLNNEKNYDKMTSDVLIDYKNMITRTVDDTLSLIDYESLIVASNLIYNAWSIGLFGVGGSKIVLEDFYAKLLRLGFNVTNEHDLHFQYVVAANLSSDDVAVVVSYSGYTKEIIDLVVKLKKKNVKTIVISANNDLETECDIFLQVSKTENYSRVYSLTSKMSIQVVLDFLFIELLNNDNEQFEKILNDTRLSK